MIKDNKIVIDVPNNNMYIETTVELPLIGTRKIVSRLDNIIEARIVINKIVVNMNKGRIKTIELYVERIEDVRQKISDYIVDKMEISYKPVEISIDEERGEKDRYIYITNIICYDRISKHIYRYCGTDRMERMINAEDVEKYIDALRKTNYIVRDAVNYLLEHGYKKAKPNTIRTRLYYVKKLIRLMHGV